MKLKELLSDKKKMNKLSSIGETVVTIALCVLGAAYLVLMIHFRGTPADELPEWWKMMWRPW